MKAGLFLVDAFTSRPFHGNPAGVCLLDAEAAAAWMQSVAAEVGAPETAFVVPGSPAPSRRGAEFALRWFTPSVEVSLCGHATLAAAHILWATGRVTDGTSICFRTASGELRAARMEAGIELDFPSLPVVPAAVPPRAEAAIGTRVVAAAGRHDWLLLEVPSEEAVEGLVPDTPAIATLQPHAVVVTARSRQGGADFVSRVFAPNEGIDEDPVTGSAHCVLGPYWAARLGRETLVGRQASRRGGIVQVRVEGDRVVLGGEAVTLVHGTIETE